MLALWRALAYLPVGRQVGRQACLPVGRCGNKALWQVNNDRSGMADACTVTLSIAGDYVAKGSTDDAVAMDISVSGTSEGVVYLTKGYTGTGRVAIWNTARTATISQVNVTACPIRLWVQGTTESSAIPDVTVTATLKDTNENTLDTDSDTVTVVKVNKVQYQSGENWVDISGTLYVSKGSTVTFKAVPAPAAASWPSGKPVWGGTAGASGTGTTKEVTFNTVSANTTDFKTVTAECGNTVTANVIVVEVEVVHPINGDFTAGKAGRIMISTKHDDAYYTTVKTTKADTVAQINDAKVKITAFVEPKVAGITVYFRVQDPDPDDLSSYDTDTDTGDNRDTTSPPANKAGSLGAASATTELKTINGVQRAAAEVELTITDRNSGDNYIVEASTGSSYTFKEQTATLVAWKRIYLETDKMYKKGATLTAAHTPDENANDDVLTVDDTSDFNVNDNINIFAYDGTNVDSTVKAKTATTITMADLNTWYPKYSGVKLQANNDTYTVTTSYFGQAYGGTTNGDDGGGFVEFVAAGTGSGNIPKYETIPNAAEYIDFFGHWFANSGDTSNMIQLIAACKIWSGDGGASEVSGNKSVVFEQEILDNAGITNKSTARDEIAVHEIGHQFVASGNHVDSLIQEVPNHANTDNCIMTYTNNKENGVVEFCKDHLYEIRDASDPR